MAAAIIKEVGKDNLVVGCAGRRRDAFQGGLLASRSNGAKAPTIVDISLLRCGELREIRRLMPDLEALKAPLGVKVGEETRTVESLKAVAEGGAWRRARRASRPIATKDWAR